MTALKLYQIMATGQQEKGLLGSLIDRVSQEPMKII